MESKNSSRKKNDLFFNIYRDRYLRSIIDYYQYITRPLTLSHLTQLNKLTVNEQTKGNHICYNIDTRDKLTLYQSHSLSFLITHLIVNIEFLSIVKETKKRNVVIYGLNIPPQPGLGDIISIPDDIQYLRTTYPLLCKISKIPSTLTFLYLDLIYPTNVNHIPDCVKYLTINCRRGYLHISRGVIPSNVTSIRFECLGQTIRPHLFPLSVKYLWMPISNSLIEDSRSLPLQVEYLNIGRKELIPNLIPKTVRKLRCGNNSEKPIQVNSIPQGVEFLYLSDSTKNLKLTPNAIPNGVSTLYFGKSYYHPLGQEDIPESVTNLRLSNTFAKLSYIPSKIVSLEAPNLFADTLPILPPTLTSLVATTSAIYKPIPLDYFPQQLTKLHFHVYQLEPHIVPSSVTNLSITTPSSLKLGSIPTSVQKLRIVSLAHISVPQGVIPSSVVKLKLEFLINNLSVIDVSSSVEYLYLQYNSEEIFTKATITIPPNYPSSIKTLKLGRKIHSSSKFPSSLRHLKIDKSYIYHKDEFFQQNDQLEIVEYFDGLDRVQYHRIKNDDKPILCEEYTKRTINFISDD
ncbi:hypothetical protein CYY_005394 [Polysphondylium violaceum]|uniref:FNIP repeat-containing protein n=1 Tax=Polysphondylium violaceum TaxID=133409 RepID=A0A8J4PUA9_9MYCE|nr:hypothetical protein CYY_005394 [Polysphondylium violaceum]